MRAGERQDERHRALSAAWREHSRKAAGLEQQLASLTRREDRIPILRDLRFAESEMARLAADLARLERERGSGPSSLRTSGSVPERHDDSSPVWAAVSDSGRAVAPSPATPKGGSARIDLDIRVKLERRQGKTALLYELSSPLETLELYERKIPGPVLELAPERFRIWLMRRLEDLNTQLGPEGEMVLQKEVERDLARLGQTLYRRLFSDEMRRTYLDFREQVRTVRITSDEPWIPWELVRPFEKKGLDGKPVEDDFLCVRFQLTRWLGSGRPPAETIRVHRLACVEAGTVEGFPPLPHAKEELSLLARLAAAHPGVTDASLPDAMYEQVEALLQKGGLQLLHVVAHGDFKAERVDEAKIVLCDNRSLRAGDLEGPLTLSFANERPFVFFNACRVGQQGWALTGLGGWAEGWVRHAGAGGFLAPQWNVRDGLAWRFAETFYDALASGHTFGSATAEARRRARALAPASPTWLAYALYAHPEGRIVWPGASCPG